MTDKVPSAKRDDGTGSTRFRKRGAQPIADLIGGMLGPAAKKRGFASVDLFAYWPDIVGSTFAEHTQPERLNWPRRLDDGGEQGFEPATLIIRCEGSRALLLQYEEHAIVERINAIFGFRAVAKLRIVQKPVVHYGPERRKPVGPVSEAAERQLNQEVAGIADEGLRDALLKLGRAIKATNATRTPKSNKQM
jgi:hypothetical protein